MIQKVLRWRAEDSPNVRLAIAQIVSGDRKPEPGLVRDEARPWGVYTQEEYTRLEQAWNGRPNPPEEIVIRGVLPFGEYLERRRLWDAQDQCEGLDACFYEGAEIKLFPGTWMDASAALARKLKEQRAKRKVLALGIDSGQGSSETVWAGVDELGISYQEARKTKDTSQIVGHTIRIIEDHEVPPEKVGFDAGGGGQQWSDLLRSRGYNVQCIPFGESPALDLKRGIHQLAARKEIKEERYAYKSRRVQMYHELSQACNPDPEVNERQFAIPDDGEYRELVRQLKAHPKLEDETGRFWLPPKQKRDERDTRETMHDRLGCSPDRSDALVVAYAVLIHKSNKVVARVF